MITALPTPVPTRQDPSNFSERADAFLSALPAFGTEANALATEVNQDSIDAASSAAEAVTAAGAANAAANVTKWVSGTTYTEGQVTWSPSTFLSYRRKTNGAGTTDPSADSTNWTLVAGTGTVTPSSTDNFTNKTLTEVVYVITDAASVDLNPVNGGIQTWTLGANRTATAGSFVAGQSLILGIDDGSAYSLTWPTITWTKVGGSGTTPTLTATGRTWIVLWKVGTTLYGSLLGSA